MQLGQRQRERCIVISALIISEDLTIIKIVLVVDDQGLSFSAVGATNRGYRYAKGFLFVPDGCGVSGALPPTNARRV